MSKAQAENHRRIRLKTWPEYFAAVWDGKKPFELRLNDRNYREVKRLLLVEWDPVGERETGRWIDVGVTHVMEFQGVLDLPFWDRGDQAEHGLVIMGLDLRGMTRGRSGTGHD